MLNSALTGPVAFTVLNCHDYGCTTARCTFGPVAFNELAGPFIEHVPEYALGSLVHTPHQASPAPSRLGSIPCSPRTAGEPCWVSHAGITPCIPTHTQRGPRTPRPPAGTSEEKLPAAGGRRRRGGGPTAGSPHSGGRREGARLSPPPAAGALPSLSAWSWRESIKSRRETRPPSCQSRRERLRRGGGGERRLHHHDQPQLLPVGLRRRQR